MRKYTLSLLIITILFACKKEEFSNSNSSATLHFSTDTITFDTIFASIGSITKTLTVYNRNNFDVKSNIILKGNSSANFIMNIDGVAGNNQSNIEIPSKDSIFIFLEVTINPSLNTTPYILTDSLTFTTGSEQQNVNIVAWGQDAYFHTANTYSNIVNGTDTTRFYYHLLDCTTPWTNDKPHVIYGYAIVDQGKILTINEGCNIYLHKNSGIIVGNPFSEFSGGSIKINGNLGNEVVFQGDRLDAWYTQSPKPAGQWDRIWLTPGSINNEINYAIIKNGNIGIHADTVFNSSPTVTINNTIIENMSGIGILGQGAHITATNTIISECGQYTVACNIGGTYNFSHCTFSNYWNHTSRKNPSILLNNYYEGADGNIYVRDLTAANFTNCIIDGSLSTEVSFQEQELGVFNYNFDHCLIKLDPTISTESSHYENVIINQSPKFEDAYEGDFHLTENSPAINAGNDSTEGTSDIEGNSRTNPDIGAYEFE
ncbi:MAG: choice-of-anchor Q domain-containing protein [Bacteroidota bacterium]|nr:choice-of-anchor Q domain-containing protein [Bacteroidota bacterium]